MSAFGGKVDMMIAAKCPLSADGPENTALFSRSFDSVVDDLSRFDESFGGSCERSCGSEPQPVFIVYRHDESGLAHQIETMKMVSL
jgi:hypothetical protein